MSNTQILTMVASKFEESRKALDDFAAVVNDVEIDKLDDLIDGLV